MNELPEEIELPPLEVIECPHNPDVCECDLVGLEDECTIEPTLEEWVAQHGELAQRERQLLSSLAANREQKAEIERLKRECRAYEMHLRAAETILGHAETSARPLCATAQKWVDRAQNAEAELASLRASVGEKWIDVKQELPPFGERVLAYSPANKHQGSRYFVTSLHVYSGKKDMIWLDEDINQWATHWRSVPEPPTVISVREKEGL